MNLETLAVKLNSSFHNELVLVIHYKFLKNTELLSFSSQYLTIFEKKLKSHFYDYKIPNHKKIF
jgi:hypothetical protein